MGVFSTPPKTHHLLKLTAFRPHRKKGVSTSPSRGTGQAQVKAGELFPFCFRPRTARKSTKERVSCVITFNCSFFIDCHGSQSQMPHQVEAETIHSLLFHPTLQHVDDVAFHHVALGRRVVPSRCAPCAAHGWNGER